MLRIDQIHIPARSEAPISQETLRNAVCRYLRISPDTLFSVTLLRRSLDARRGREPRYVCTVDAAIRGERQYLKQKKLPAGVHKAPEGTPFRVPNLAERLQERPRPVVVGFGPAGLFCALMLARAGLQPIVIERGEPVEDRSRRVQTFWKTGCLDPWSNVQFGEGGAGTFSDGKLNTLIKDKEQIGRLILQEMVQAGAPEQILYEAKPHIGTDRLQTMVRNIREEILSLGGEVRFRSQMIRLETEGSRLIGLTVRKSDAGGVEQETILATDAVFLCVGHSARDTFETLKSQQVPMQAKAFAMGVRVEHLQSWINEARYHEYATRFGAASYKVTHRASNGRGVYSFCMCPGGVVVSACSEEGRLVTNGMSRFARDEKNANSALIVTVSPEDYLLFAKRGEEMEPDVLAGMRFQRDLEEKAFLLGGSNYRAPVQRVEDFHLRKASRSVGEVEPSFTGGWTPQNLWEILPEYMGTAIDEGLKAFEKQIAGFDHPDAILTGVEARTSSPVRILRDEKTGQSTLIGLYPVGEGAGYAGGIMSAAIDGVKAARKYMES